MKVLYKWVKKHDPKISSPTHYRFITYDDETAKECGEKDYEIKNITLESRLAGSKWSFYESYNSYTQVLNLLHLIENATGKKIKGSYT